VSGLTDQVQALIAQSTESIRLLQASVSSLSAATIDAIRGMNSGAETLYVAATDFAKAGQGVSGTMDAASSATEKMQGAAQMLSASTASTQRMVEDYSRTGATFAAMVLDLKTTVEIAKREASMTSELMSKLQAATAQLALAQQQSEDYLKGVSEVLTKAHEAFAENVERTLRQGNAQFHKELSQAVGLLSGAIQDFGDTLESVASKG
jgi:ABC-type transporter Mla subunit MlaD